MQIRGNFCDKSRLTRQLIEWSLNTASEGSGCLDLWTARLLSQSDTNMAGAGVAGAWSRLWRYQTSLHTVGTAIKQITYCRLLLQWVVMQAMAGILNLVRKVHVRNEVQIRFGKVHPTQLPYSVLMVSSIVMPTQRGGSMLRRRLRGDTHRNIKAMARKPASLSHPALLQPLHDRLKRCFLGPWRLLSNTELGSVVAPRKVIKLTGLCKERSMAALSDVFEPLGKKKENEKVTEE